MDLYEVHELNFDSYDGRIACSDTDKIIARDLNYNSALIFLNQKINDLKENNS